MIALDMARVPTPTCKKCDILMTRMYNRPTGGNYTPIGFVCACGHVEFDDKRNSAFEKAWAFLKRGGQ